MFKICKRNLNSISNASEIQQRLVGYKMTNNIWMPLPLPLPLPLQKV
ncbi:MAG TPA: hypothetical protein VGC75_05790 [Candidatus Nitrosocosmicus sp.]